MKDFVTAIRDHMKDRMKEYVPVMNRLDGTENWFQTEVIIGGVKAGYDITVWKKKNYDSDVVLNLNGKKIGIELKMYRKGGGDIVYWAKKQHPDAHYYLILHEPSSYIENIIIRTTMPVFEKWSITLIQGKQKP